MIDFLISRWNETQREEALVRGNESCTYGALLDAVGRWRRRLVAERVPRGTVATVEADFSAESVAALLALVEHECIVVPIAPSSESKLEEFRGIALAELLVTFEGSARIERTGIAGAHP